MYTYAAVRAITLLLIWVYRALYCSVVLWFFRLWRKSMVCNFARWPTCKSRVSNHLMHIFLTTFSRNVKFAQSRSRNMILFAYYEIPRNVWKHKSAQFSFAYILIVIAICNIIKAQNISKKTRTLHKYTHEMVIKFSCYFQGNNE